MFQKASGYMPIVVLGQCTNSGGLAMEKCRDLGENFPRRPPSIFFLI